MKKSVPSRHHDNSANVIPLESHGCTSQSNTGSSGVGKCVIGEGGGGGGSNWKEKEAWKSQRAFGERENHDAMGGGWRLGEEEREIYLAEQVKMRGHDPMLLKCYIKKLEKIREQRKSLPPIPSILVIEPDEDTDDTSMDKSSGLVHTPECGRHNEKK